MERVRTFELPFHDLRNVRRDTRNVIEWCDRSLRVVSDKGGVGKKPGRATCAMIVIKAWAFVRGKTPGANNHEVHAICDEYWLACGCASIGRSAQLAHINGRRLERTQRSAPYPR